MSARREAQVGDAGQDIAQDTDPPGGVQEVGLRFYGQLSSDVRLLCALWLGMALALVVLRFTWNDS